MSLALLGHHSVPARHAQRDCHSQTSFPETEPNVPKSEANAITFTTVGDSFTGNTQGTSTTGGNSAPSSADTYLITFPVAPAAIYRNRLVITTSGTAGHTGTIHGLTQTAGVINIGTDVLLQASAGSTTPPRFNQWYSFGTVEQIYYRITGTTSTTENYTATWEREVVTPVSIGSFIEGNIEITTVGQGHSTDTDLWVYDANFNPIPTYGNDDEFSSRFLQSRLNRSYTPGTYYLALTNFNLANSEPSPADDDFRNGSVTDFARLVLNSSSTFNLNLGFAFTDINGTTQFAATKVGPYDILWFNSL